MPAATHIRSDRSQSSAQPATPPDMPIKLVSTVALNSGKMPNFRIARLPGGAGEEFPEGGFGPRKKLDGVKNQDQDNAGGDQDRDSAGKSQQHLDDCLAGPPLFAQVERRDVVKVIAGSAEAANGSVGKFLSPSCSCSSQGDVASLDTPPNTQEGRRVCTPWPHACIADACQAQLSTACLTAPWRRASSAWPG